LFDRYSGFEDHIAAQIRAHYRVAVIEHFWCASYANLLRPHADLLVLDLHNVESQLAATLAEETSGLEAFAFRRFRDAYERLEKNWLPRFDLILVTSEVDAKRIRPAAGRARVCVFPNALLVIPRPDALESESIVFSGNLEYHPNIEAVRWFRSAIWPRVKDLCPTLSWHVVGRNAGAIQSLMKDDPRIRVIGPVDDAVTTLASSRICIVPLRSGSGTRFKIIEAWAAGRAVVSTALGAEGLGAEPGKHLLIADQPEEFADSIARLNDDPGLRKKLGDAGREFYLDRFTWPVAWRALERAGL